MSYPGKSLPSFDKGWYVLAIDDDPLFLEVVQVCLERSGCVVDTVVDPQDGLNRALEGRYDLVLLDLMMPGLAGEEILSLLKPLSLKQCVVVVSGSEEREARARARDLGASGYIQKPVDTRQFTALLCELLQDSIQNAPPQEDTTPGNLQDWLVAFVFGEGPSTPGRRAGAVVILIGIISIAGLLVLV